MNALGASIIIGYIVTGIALGPWGLNWVSDTRLIADIAEVGIIFPLFLLGLNLTPQKLLQLFRQTALVTLMTSVVRNPSSQVDQFDTFDLCVE